jgi:predicted GTPase
MRTFLIIGQTGVGKSSFINATFGEKTAEISEFEACTKLIEYYPRQTI